MRLELLSRAAHERDRAARLRLTVPYPEREIRETEARARVLELAADDLDRAVNADSELLAQRARDTAKERLKDWNL